jgi:hypothetical protein
MSFPKHCWSVAQTVDLIRNVLGHDGVRIERFKVEAVTSKGSKMVLAWDRRDVGQPHTVTERTILAGPRDPVNEYSEATHKRKKVKW